MNQKRRYLLCQEEAEAPAAQADAEEAHLIRIMAEAAAATEEEAGAEEVSAAVPDPAEATILEAVRDMADTAEELAAVILWEPVRAWDVSDAEQSLF